MMVAISINNGYETFVFEDGMIDSVKPDVVADIDKNQMPISGPMSNQGYDSNGAGKTITISGRLYDTSSTVTTVQNIRSMEVMKLWLEALLNGNQTAYDFTSNYEYVSVSGPGTSVITDSVSGASITLRASFATTKVYVDKFSCEEVEGNPSILRFDMTLWVAGF